MFEPSTSAADAISVTQLNREAKRLLERGLGELWIEGEISGFSQPRSGHCYFTLKDDSAQVRCALFKSRAQFLREKPKDGDRVRVRAKVSLFEARGDYQLIVEALQQAGLGEWLARLARLREQLAAEGVFANQRALPHPPQHLGVITSATGAALQDVIAVTRKRWPQARLSVLSVAVQGPQAVPQLIRAVAMANRDSDCDALLITRGGGSLEDLWAFNDQHLARAIYHSRLPVVAAIGHETDTTLAELAADLRAPTPSAAAEALFPDQRALAHQLDALSRRLWRTQRAVLDQAAQRLDHARSRLRHPARDLGLQRERANELERRLHTALRQRLQSEQENAAQLERRLKQASPARDIARHRQQISMLTPRLMAALPRRLASDRERLEGAMRALNAVSPLNVINRGYAIVERSGSSGSPQVIRAAHQTQPGEMLSIRLGEGRLAVEVKRRYKPRP
ncbi:exodeoxyribonuclease VII large subunit [Cobetia sp. L2A1]|uniref:exodeoxyribonuclease VII large subunit n=1 Tax=Cobetia sp. L2A1 TaxID=2686360 RepID=UPI001E459DF6|nr:exodeoxyribonuclease VII large subunit [Cobetia sp. L2A1]